MAYVCGDLGKSLSYLKDLGSKGKLVSGSRGIFFQGVGEINVLFSGIKGAQTPLVPHRYSRRLVNIAMAIANVQRVSIEVQMGISTEENR